MTILISDKADLGTKNITRDKDGIPYKIINSPRRPNNHICICT